MSICRMLLMLLTITLVVPLILIKKDTMMHPDEEPEEVTPVPVPYTYHVPPQDRGQLTFTASFQENSPYAVYNPLLNTTTMAPSASTTHTVYPSYIPQSLPPYPLLIDYALIRQIIQEELRAYFEEGQDILGVTSPLDADPDAEEEETLP